MKLIKYKSDSDIKVQLDRYELQRILAWERMHLHEAVQKAAADPRDGHLLEELLEIEKALDLR